MLFTARPMIDAMLSAHADNEEAKIARETLFGYALPTNRRISGKRARGLFGFATKNANTR